VEKIVSDCSEQSADAIVRSLFQRVIEHASGTEPFDDQTVVAIRVKGDSGKRK
jgi:serine phosphatase RsbU (regulator of sigma subunit)